MIEPAAPPVIEVCRLSKRFVTQFGVKDVLREVSFRIDPGEAVAMVGMSGEGKSVVLRIITGLLAADRGEVLIDNNPVGAPGSAEYKRFYEKMSLVFQHGALFDSASVWENIAFSSLYGPNRLGLTRSQARQKALEQLIAVDLSTQVANQSTASLSGGMQRRVAVARALFTDPSVLFLDEPTAGLDPSTSKTIGRLIKRALGGGVTGLTITHDIQTVLEVSRRVIVLKDGCVFWDGPTADLANVDDDFIRSFFQRV